MLKRPLKIAQRTDIVRKTAEICQVSMNYVQKIRRGERNNEYVMEVLVELQVAERKVMQELCKLVPYEGVKRAKPPSPRSKAPQPPKGELADAR